MFTILISVEKKNEANREVHPILPYSLLSKPTYAVTMIMALLSGTFIGAIIFIPSFAEQVLNIPAEKSGYWMIPLALASGVGAGGVVGGGLLVGLFGDTFEGEEKSEDTNTDYNDSRQFFKRKEDFDVISAATERIFPEEEMGPGAIELGVPYYIDRQLAGA